MISKITYLEQIKKVVQGSRNFDQEFCGEYQKLNKEDQFPVARLLNFFGCAAIKIPAEYNSKEVDEEDRLAVIELMLLYLFVQTGEPKWSSLIFEKMFNVIMDTPGGGIKDIYTTLYNLLAKISKLSTPMANFIQEVYITSFRRYNQSFKQVDFNSIILNGNNKINEAQAYLLLLSVPENEVFKYKSTILKALAGTSFFTEAEQILSED